MTVATAGKARTSRTSRTPPTSRAPRADRPEEPAPRKLGRGAREAAERVVRRNAVRIEAFGRHVELPPVEELAFFAGLGVLALLEIVEWPVAVVIAVGHTLAHSNRGRVLREFGDALEAA